MLDIPKDIVIYYCSLPVDLRKGCDGLAYISSSIILNPPGDTLFMFVNRKRSRMKILYVSRENLSYWFVRSKKGVFAPKKTITSKISPKEMKSILDGHFPDRLKQT